MSNRLPLTHPLYEMLQWLRGREPSAALREEADEAMRDFTHAPIARWDIARHGRRAHPSSRNANATE